MRHRRPPPRARAHSAAPQAIRHAPPAARYTPRRSPPPELRRRANEIAEAVYAAIRNADSERGQAAIGARAAARPGRARVPVAACLLLLLLCVKGPSAPLRASAAGPLEARQAYESAKQLSGAAWIRQVAAFRGARALANPSDSTQARAVRAIARRLHAEDRPAGRHAALAAASRLMPRGDRDRVTAQLRLARALVDEGDLAAGRRGLEELVARATADSRRDVGRALALLAELQFEAGDLPGLEETDRLMVSWRVPPGTRLRALGRAGELAHERAQRGTPSDSARSFLERARRLYDAARRDDPDDTDLHKAWLDLGLRRLVEGNER